VTYVIVSSKKLFSSHIFLFFSALSYGLAFLFPETLWGLIFLYPLFFLVARSADCLSIFLWSFCLSSMHLFGVCIALYRMGIAWFYLFGLLLYVPLSGCVVFFLARQCFFWIKDTFFSDLFGLIAYRLWVTYLILLPFGRVEGYILMHPVILLSKNVFTPIIEQYDLVALTILFHLGSAMPLLLYKLLREYRKKQYQFAVIILSGILLCILPYFKKQTIMCEMNQFDTKKIAVLPLLFARTQNISELFRLLETKIKNIISSNKKVRLIVLPEGSIDVPLSPELVDEFFQKQLPDISILFGASCWKKNAFYNSCFFKIPHANTRMYRKRHALPLTERSIFSFFSVACSIKPSKNQHLLLKVDDMQFVPYICSEFFFDNTPDDEYHQYPIMLLCNDIWFSGIAAYIQDLMVKTVQFKAKNWSRPVVYIAYSQSFFVDQNGNRVFLNHFLL
jgi:hypothetical protein